MNTEFSQSSNVHPRKIEMLYVREMESRFNFFIPSYQRGYRWKEKQVEQLIDDINDFSQTEKKPFYFLQALAVAKDDEGKKLNVVDGQQRLTTLNLILGNVDKCINIEYARETDMAIDNYYKEKAMAVITSKLGDEADERRVKFCNKIKKQCCFLYYEVEKNRELTTFNELNSGKIPAKDSELVKCIMLSPGADETFGVTRSRADEWDAIERELNKDDFFAFMTPRKTWREDDRMTVLFRYAGIDINEKTDDIFPFLTCVLSRLKEKSRETLWKDICSVYYRLISWFNNPIMYHAFGAFVHQRGKKSILSLLKHSDLVTVIEEMATYNPNTDRDDYNGGKNDKLYQYLLLSNVAFCWKHWPMRYSFLHHREVSDWSLEHIFARNQRNLSPDELKQWCPGFSDDDIKDYLKDSEEHKGNEWLAKKLKDKYPKEEDNSIGNLAMLPKNANSALNNKLFEGKRSYVCEWANNSWSKYWVPPVTEAVFLKSIVDLDVSEPYWSDKDKSVYVANMEECIKLFIAELKKYQLSL